MSAHFNLFLYGPLRDGVAPAALLQAMGAGPRAERVGCASVAGTLYDTREELPALVLAGKGSVAGEVWRCPASLLWRLDAHEGVDVGRVRRVGVRAGPHACWTYVAGAKLIRRG